MIDMATDARIRANTKWQKKTYDNIYLRLRKDAPLNADALKQAADAVGLSVNAFIIEAIEEKIARNTP